MKGKFFSILPIAIGVNGHPLLCKNTLKCSVSSEDMASNISDNLVDLIGNEVVDFRKEAIASIETLGISPAKINENVSLS